jgi:hypothetical protein
VRGTKGNKVLRTKKIKVQDLSRWHYSQGWENHFCKLGCLMDFIKEHFNDVIALGPRTECLETPIEDPKKTTHSNNYGYSWTNTEIVEKEGDQVRQY